LIYQPGSQLLWEFLQSEYLVGEAGQESLISGMGILEVSAIFNSISGNDGTSETYRPPLLG
jgi:hypothetical protein